MRTRSRNAGAILRTPQRPVAASCSCWTLAPRGPVQGREREAGGKTCLTADRVKLEWFSRVDMRRALLIPPARQVTLARSALARCCCPHASGPVRVCFAYDVTGVAVAVQTCRNGDERICHVAHRAGAVKSPYLNGLRPAFHDVYEFRRCFRASHLLLILSAASQDICARRAAQHGRLGSGHAVRCSDARDRSSRFLAQFGPQVRSSLPRLSHLCR
jgi:hypothetical protein